MFADSVTGLVILRFEIFRACTGIGAFVSTRTGGISSGSFESLNVGMHVGDSEESVLENRRRVLVASGGSLNESVWCNQIHRPNVAIVTEPDRGRGSTSTRTAVQAADAMVTDVPGLTLCVMLADCVPVLIYDPIQQVVAVAHAGWGGTVREIVKATVLEMQRSFDSQPKSLKAGIGPSIGPDKYEVGAQVIELALERDWGRDCLSFTKPGTAMFDLWKANKLQLERAGIPESHIEVCQISTIDNQELLFSDRASRPTGRFMAGIRLNYN
jgi:polyphenol oxidase